jgi:hypothetical protein
MRRPPPPAARPGVALLLTLVFTAALALLAAGMLALALRESAIAGSATAALRARLAAESAVRSAFPASTLGALLAWEDGGGAGVARVDALRDGLFLVRGMGAALRPGGAVVARASAGAVLASLDPAAAAAAFSAAVAAAGPVRVGAGAAVHGAPAGAEHAPAADAAGACSDGADRRHAAAIAAPSATLLIDADAIIDGALAGAAPAPPPLAPGETPFTWHDLSLLADRVEQGALHLAPVTGDDACVRAAPGNWGDPLSPAAPCGAHAPLVHAPGGLAILAGAGQGILVVDGDLHLAGEATFHGAILVRGAVTVDAGATIVGALRGLDPDALVRIDGSVRFSACVLDAIFTQSPGFRRPIRPSARLWIPIF